MGISRWCCVVVLGLCVGGCGGGLGPQLAARDFANAFAYRDLPAVEAISTPEFRSAVWSRLKPEEFRAYAELMGRGQDGELIDTEFQENQAMILVRTPSRQQYRIHAKYRGTQWLVDDVLKEKSPSEYISLRKQAEAMLAVRDFRDAVLSGDLASLQAASSRGFSDEVWKRISPQLMKSASQVFRILQDTAQAELQPLEEKAELRSAKVKGPLGVHLFQFTNEGGRLVVDDVSLPGSKKSLRIRLRAAIAVKEWLED